MSQQPVVVCDYSESDDDIALPSPAATRRSIRLQNRDSPWTQWSSERIINTLQAAGIPINQDLSRDDLVLLAFNTLGSPPESPADTAQSFSATSGQSKTTGRKRSAKSSSPRPVKKHMTLAQASQPPTNYGAVDANTQLIQAVKSLSDTVKVLESKMAIFENAVAGCAPGSTPPFFSSVFPTAPHHASGSNDQISAPSTSHGVQAPNQSASTSSQDINAPLSSSHYNLSTAVPAQAYGRRFVSPAAVTVSPLTRQNIIQGKDINLASLLLPSPAIDRQMVDCGDVAVYLKTSDPRLQRNLSFGEFVIAFGIYRDVLCEVFPKRREELDLYLAMMADFNQRYGGTLFYEYHKSLSAKSASLITLFNSRLDWSVTDTELLVRHFGGQKISACLICSSHGHSAHFCPKTYNKKDTDAVHGPAEVSKMSDARGRPITKFNGFSLCNNFNESVCSFPNCKFAHICSFCKDPHPKSVCPRRFKPPPRVKDSTRKKF